MSYRVTDSDLRAVAVCLTTIPSEAIAFIEAIESPALRADALAELRDRQFGWRSGETRLAAEFERLYSEVKYA